MLSPLRAADSRQVVEGGTPVSPSPVGPGLPGPSPGGAWAGTVGSGGVDAGSGPAGSEARSKIPSRPVAAPPDRARAEELVEGLQRQHDGRAGDQVTVDGLHMSSVGSKACVAGVGVVEQGVIGAHGMKPGRRRWGSGMIVGVVMDDGPVIVEGIGRRLRGGQGGEGFGKGGRRWRRRNEGERVERVRDSVRADGSKVARKGVLPVGGGPEVEGGGPVGGETQPPLRACRRAKAGVVVDGTVRACVDQVEIGGRTGRGRGGER